MFRELKADEIDCRVAMVKKNGCSILLYKDARVDQNILDETFGPFGWERKHELIGDRLYCTVSVYSEDLNMWVSKQDVGTESNTEKEKGQASDSFKRACFNWGIGRELYTAPFIWIPAEKCNISQKGQGYTTYDRFVLKNITYKDHAISGLVIANASDKGKIVYRYGTCKEESSQSNPKTKSKPDENTGKKYISDQKVKALLDELESNGISVNTVCELYKVDRLERLTERQHSNIIHHMKEIKEHQDGKRNGESSKADPDTSRAG